MTKEKATAIVKVVLKNIEGRKGIGDELEQIEPLIRRELEESLIRLVMEHTE